MTQRYCIVTFDVLIFIPLIIDENVKILKLNKINSVFFFFKFFSRHADYVKSNMSAGPLITV